MAQSKLPRGFTLLEVILVIALGVFLVGLTLPVGINYYRSQITEETGMQMTSILVRASSESRLGKDNSAFGVRFFPENYVYFQGDSYADRDASRDENYPISKELTITTPTDEFVFAKLTGAPTATGTIILTQFERTLSITIDEFGMISGN